MTGYEFPVIKNISDIMPAIDGRDEFIIADRDTFKICNYIVNYIDTFPPIYDDTGNYNLIAALRRECRGITFDSSNGNILRRPFNKFFNLAEKNETQIHNLDFSKPHKRYTKLDGSFITPFEIQENSGIICYGTKMGRTAVSEIAEEYVKKNVNYQEFSKWCIKNKLSPTYELTSPRQRIVINYPVESLTLLAVREMHSGVYIDIESLHEITKFDIPIVEAHDQIDDPKEFLQSLNNMKGIEGFVIAWENGYRIKMKTSEYCMFHKTKDQINLEKNIVNMIVNNTLDDTKGFMLKEDLQSVEEFENKFNIGISETVKKYDQYFNSVSNLDKKSWAINHMPEMKIIDPVLVNIVFGKYQGRDTRTMIIDHIKNNCNTQNKIDGIRYLWGGAKWKFNFEGDI